MVFLKAGTFATPFLSHSASAAWNKPPNLQERLSFYHFQNIAVAFCREALYSSSVSYSAAFYLLLTSSILFLPPSSISQKLHSPVHAQSFSGEEQSSPALQRLTSDQGHRMRSNSSSLPCTPSFYKSLTCHRLRNSLNSSTIQRKKEES